MEEGRQEVLIAGVGNVLHGDDGFGIELARRLMHRDDLPPSVKVIETGIGGMSLIQEIMAGYQALLLLDACKRGGETGRIYLLEPELPDLNGLDPHGQRDYFADTHYATPTRALSLLQRLGRLPPTVQILACEAGDSDELRIGLSEPVDAAMNTAQEMVFTWLGELEPSRVKPTVPGE